MFSGTRNPVFQLSGSQRNSFCDAIIAEHKMNRSLASLPSCRVLGFTGFKACVPDVLGSKESCYLLRGAGETIDNMLLAYAAEHAQTLMSPEVYSHIFEELVRLRELGGDKQCLYEPAVLFPSHEDKCSVAVHGPDDPTKVHFDPQTDDSGCFVIRQSDNNCYDYGVDISTNTFAQPGRGSGRCAPGSRPCVANTCEDVKAAAVSDGLTWIGTDLPTSLPPSGHYVSLHIWPSTNFHWLRMDANKFWSHKPGGSPVRNVDNTNQKIQDPSKADVSPWTQHCGYLLAMPSKSNITSILGNYYLV